jgi:hypothetical protein
MFGGVFPNPDPQPDGCSNDLHIFNLGFIIRNNCSYLTVLGIKNWHSPIVFGQKPTPRSGYFSFGNAICHHSL